MKGSSGLLGNSSRFRRKPNKSWTLFGLLAIVALFLVLFWLSYQGAPPNVNDLRSDVHAETKVSTAEDKEAANVSPAAANIGLEDLRKELRDAFSEIRALVEVEVHRAVRDEISKVLSELPKPSAAFDASHQEVHREMKLESKDVEPPKENSHELSEAERAWARKPDSFCIGKGDITVITVVPGLEAHIEQSEIKERGQASNLGEAYLEKMRRNRLLYIKRHGYQYCELQGKLDPTRPASWSKVSMALQVLRTDPAIFHIDADAIFVDMKKSIETMLEESGASEAELVFSNDHESDVADNHSAINCGVFFTRSNEWTIFFWERIYTDFPEAINHEWWEQKAVRDFRDSHYDEWNEHAMIIPHWRMNSRLDWYKFGQFIAHGAQTPKPYRFQQLLKYMLITDPENEGYWQSVSLGQYT